MPAFLTSEEVTGADKQQARRLAAIRFFALVLFPTISEADTAARKNVHAQVGLDFMRTNNLAGADGSAWERILVRPFFGLGLADGLGIKQYESHYLKRVEQSELVALVIRIWPAAQLHHDHEFRGGLTLTKLLHVAADVHGVDPTGLHKVFKKFRPIAHLIAAFAQLRLAIPNHGEFPTVEHVPALLNLARRYQEFLVSEVTSPTKFNNSLLPLKLEEMWTIPDSVGPLALPTQDVVFDPLDPSVVETIKARKSPLPYVTAPRDA